VLLLVAGCVVPTTLTKTTVGNVDSDSPATPGAIFANPAGEVLSAVPSGLAPAVGGEFLTGLGATEPTIGVTKDGSIFMTALRENPHFQAEPYVPYAGMQHGPTVVMSSDEGQTWKDLFAPLPTGDSKELRTWDPYVYVDTGTGRVFMDDIYPISCGTMSFSDNKGSTWTTDPYSCGNTNVNDHQTVVAAKPRTVPASPLYAKLVYRCVNNLADSACAISLDGGLNFLPERPVATAAEGCSALTGHLRADHDGRVYLPFECNGAPAYAMTENDGLSWSVVTIGPGFKTNSHDTSLAIDEAGNIYAVFANNDSVYYSASTDHGKTWMPERRVNPLAITGTQFDAIAVGAPGHVAIAYIGTTVPGGFAGKQDGNCDLVTNVCTQGSGWANATWNGYLTVATDALNASAPFETVPVNPPTDPLARQFCGHSRCYGMNDFLDIVIDGNGRPWASFVDVCTQKCVTDSSLSHDVAIGFAGTLLRGPALSGSNATLVPIAAQLSKTPTPAAGSTTGEPPGLPLAVDSVVDSEGR
jgi:hypothetical protein